MENPLVSIIIPVYNADKYIDNCIKSVVDQTYSNLEIIIVDDGSTDQSQQKCFEWAQRDTRIYFIKKTNGGAADARNVGLKHSSGEYVMFIDSDDFIATNMIESLYNIIINSDSDIACGGFFRYCDNKIYRIYNECINDIITFDRISLIKSLLNSKIDCSACGKLYKKRIIGNLTFKIGRQNEDMLFLFNLYLNCNKITYTSTRYYYYRDTANSVTHVLSQRTMSLLKNCLEIGEIVDRKSIPVRSAMKNYKCRVCLELGYIIQKQNAKDKFINEAQYTKKYILSNLLYIILSSFYNIRDLIHAIIIIYKL